MSPLIAMGYLYGCCTPFAKAYQKVLFFPFYHTGGAEAVHARVAKVWGGPDTLIIFTRKSTDNRYFTAFVQTNSTVLDYSKYTGTKWLYPVNIFFRGVLAARLAKAKPVLVFNGQCNFAYKLSPWLPKAIPQVELIHSFNSFSWIRLPYLAYYRKSICIAQVALQKHVQQYKNLGVPEELASKWTFISNGVPVPQEPTVKSAPNPLTVLWVGRNSEEKRLGVFEQLATQALHLPIQFICIGTEKPNTNNIQYIPTITQESALAKWYAKAHMLCITSSTEGFPMVVMEAAAHGCLILSTPVGDIPHRLQNEPFAYITQTIEPTSVIEEMVAQLQQWTTTSHLAPLHAQAYSFASNHFSLATFERNYTQLASEYKKN